MKKVGLDLTVEGDISDFLGVEISKKEDGKIHLTQPHLIDQILKDVRLTADNVSVKQTPCQVTAPLKRHSQSDAFDGRFDYRSVIGKLNYLEKSTRPDISYAVHQCARFQSDPKKEHGNAVMWICRYLAGTRDKGLIFDPKEQSFDCYVDADFTGNWDKEGEPETDPDTARSRTGFVVFFAGCPLLWTSKLQGQISLSSTESEYVALSAALRQVIPLMELAKEMAAQGIDVQATTPKVHCRVFEDNSGALEMATTYKMRPRTRHLNVQYHHFRHHVEQGLITIHAIRSEDQPADILTHPVTAAMLQKHRLTIMGWE